MDHDKGVNNNNINEDNTSSQNGVDAGETSSSQQSNFRDPLNNTQYLTDTDDEDFVDYTFRSDSPLELLDNKDVRKQNVDRIPLIPTEFTSIREAIQNFTAVFESRFLSYF
jgi:hypothetical protein